MGIVHQLLRQHPLRRQRCRRNQLAVRLQGMKRLPIPHQPGRPPNTGYRLQLGYQRRRAQVGQHALERPAHEHLPRVPFRMQQRRCNLGIQRHRVGAMVDCWEVYAVHGG